MGSAASSEAAKSSKAKNSEAKSSEAKSSIPLSFSVATTDAEVQVAFDFVKTHGETAFRAWSTLEQLRKGKQVLLCRRPNGDLVGVTTFSPPETCKNTWYDPFFTKTPQGSPFLREVFPADRAKGKGLFSVLLPAPPKNRTVVIGAVVVAKNHRRGGLAKGMISHVMRLTRTTHFVTSMAHGNPVRPSLQQHSTQRVGTAFRSDFGEFFYNDEAKTHLHILGGSDLNVVASVLHLDACEAMEPALEGYRNSMWPLALHFGLSALNILRACLPATAWPNLFLPVSRRENKMHAVLKLLDDVNADTASTLAPIIAREIEFGLDKPLVWRSPYYKMMTTRFLDNMSNFLLQRRADGVARLCSNENLLCTLDGPTVLGTDWANLYNYPSSAATLADQHSPLNGHGDLLLRYREALRSSASFDLWTLNPTRFGVDFMSGSPTVGQVGAVSFSATTSAALGLSLYGRFSGFQQKLRKAFPALPELKFTAAVRRAAGVYTAFNFGAFWVTVATNLCFEPMQQYLKKPPA